MVDQQIGSTAFDDRKWQGWFDEDVEFVLDLGEEMELNEISLRFLVDRKNQILLPKKVQFLVSTNNTAYTLLETFVNDETLNNDIKIVPLNKKSTSLEANYIKIIIENSSNERTTEKGWTFIDELIVQ